MSGVYAANTGIEVKKPCLNCGRDTHRSLGPWEWRCPWCNFCWDSEDGVWNKDLRRTGGNRNMRYLKNDVDIKGRLSKVPYGCLCVVNGEEV